VIRGTTDGGGGGGSLRPIFDEFLCPADYDALLTLSRDAGGLLRHARTCCLRSLADVLEIDERRLLVMADTQRRPSTTITYS